MNTVAPVVEPRIAELSITESEITAYLVDGRSVSVPLAWSWRKTTPLLGATAPRSTEYPMPQNRSTT